jgi:PleD family two-component response regulator
MIGAHRDINAETLLYKQSQQLNNSLQETVEQRTAELLKLTKQLAEKVHEAEKLANTDYLTGLSKRLHFEKH